MPFWDQSLEHLPALLLLIYQHSARRESEYLIEIEKYLDELWDVSNSLYHIKDRLTACLNDDQDQVFETAYDNQLNKFFSIWDTRKRIIELNVYFNDPECSYIFRKIESLYNESKNKIEAMSPLPIADNDKLLEGLLDIEDEIYGLRDNLSKKLRHSISLGYILFPTFSKWRTSIKDLLNNSSNK